MANAKEPKTNRSLWAETLIAYKWGCLPENEGLGNILLDHLKETCPVSWWRVFWGNDGAFIYEVYASSTGRANKKGLLDSSNTCASDILYRDGGAVRLAKDLGLSHISLLKESTDVRAVWEILLHLNNGNAEKKNLGAYSYEETEVDDFSAKLRCALIDAQEERAVKKVAEVVQRAVGNGKDAGDTQREEAPPEKQKLTPGEQAIYDLAFLGKKQTEIAQIITEKLSKKPPEDGGRKECAEKIATLKNEFGGNEIKQYQVSRILEKCKAKGWHLSVKDGKPIAIDPTKIELGRRTDGR